MVKGWRNNPQWVEYFNKKQEAKLRRQIDRLMVDSQIKQMQMASEESLRSLERAMTNRVECNLASM